MYPRRHRHGRGSHAGVRHRTSKNCFASINLLQVSGFFRVQTFLPRARHVPRNLSRLGIYAVTESHLILRKSVFQPAASAPHRDLRKYPESPGGNGKLYITAPVSHSAHFCYQHFAHKLLLPRHTRSILFLFPYSLHSKRPEKPYTAPTISFFFIIDMAAGLFIIPFP